MSLLKSQVKVGTIRDIGYTLDDLKESAEKDQIRGEGYDKALQDVADGLKSIFAAVEADMEEGAFNADKIEGSPLLVAKAVKHGLLRVLGSIDNLQVRSTEAKALLKGKIQGLDAAVHATKKKEITELKKVVALEEGLKNGTITTEDGSPRMVDQTAVRPVGTHPGHPLTDRRTDLNARRAAAKTEKEAKANGKASESPAKKVASKKSPRNRIKKKGPSKADAPNA